MSDTVETKTKDGRRGSRAAEILLRKRIPLALHFVLFGICLCFGGWYATRGMLAQSVLGMSASPALRAVIANDVTAFLLGGVTPFLVYFIATRFTYRMMLAGGARPPADQAYLFRTFYALGYLVYGAFSILYFAVPALELYGETIVRFLIVGAFVALYVVFECRHGLPKRGRAVALYAYGMVFSLIYLAYSLAELFMTIGGVI